MRAALESDLSTTASRLVKKATEHGWVTVGVVSEGCTDGQVETVLSVRGRRRGGGRFVALFVDGSFEAAWWWTREHSAVVKGYREVVRTTKLNAWTVNIAKKLEHDPELDEVVHYRSEVPTRERLGSLSELVGVAGGKRPRPGLLETPVLDSEVS